MAVITVGQTDKAKSGYAGEPGFGGPTSVGAQLEEDDEVKDPAIRIPAIDGILQPWFDWKKSLNERYGFQLGLDYNMLHQGASDTLTDEDQAATPSSQGIAFGVNWTFDEKFMPFVRAGWSDGDAPLMNKTATVGLIHRFHKSDLIGFGFNWGDPSDDALRDQYSSELFYRFQISQKLALTPSVQLLIDPALNPNEDRIGVVGLRVRIPL